MKTIALTSVALASLLLAACAPAPAPQPEAPPEAAATIECVPAAEGEIPAEVQERLRTAAKTLAGRLKGRLVKELGAGGPVHALGVCSEVAQDMAGEFSADGISVRRVSLKVRNAADEPDAFERAWLEHFESVHASGGELGEVFVVADADGARAAHYFLPIKIAGPCLNCHGKREELAPELVAKLDELYPDDAATGYVEGDLRGAFSVRAAF